MVIELGFEGGRKAEKLFRWGEPEITTTTTMPIIEVEAQVKGMATMGRH